MSLMVMSVLGTKGYERTIEEMKAYLGKVLGWHTPESTPSAQALSQARRKLTPERCREVVVQVRARCTTSCEHRALGYGGFNLLAIDGTKAPLPAYRTIIDHFGCPTQAPKGPQASLTVLWDVGANQPVDWQLGPYRVCERLHALNLLAGTGPQDLVLADCNFASRRILFQLSSQRSQWLMNIRCAGSGTLAEVVDFVDSGLLEQTRSLVMRDHYGHQKADLPVITVRLLRQVSPNGTIRVFVTSLTDTEQHPAAVLLNLYACRWRVETAFRELKLWHGLERFHARYPDGIYQEVAALMLFQLLSSELEAKARVHHQLPSVTPPEDITPPDAGETITKPTVRFNRRIVADCAVGLLFAAAQGDQRLREEFDYCLFRIWRYRQKVRDGRSFPRKRNSPARGWKDKFRKGKP